jgi:hypothetical protein
MTPKFDKFVNNLVSKYGKKEVHSGMDIEKEHKDVTHGDKLKTAKIAAAHLKEVPDYYKKLKKYVEPESPKS